MRLFRFSLPPFLIGFFCFALLAGRAAAQDPAKGGNQVNILRSDLLEGTADQKKLIGNVQLQQGNVLIYCNLAIQNVTQNTLQAYGNVRIMQGDSVTLTGDSALYFGNTRVAKVTGRRVVLNDGTVVLTTRRLDYNLNSHVAVYSGGGTIVDGKSTLTSREGTYNTETRLSNYYRDVHIVDPQSVITADSLRYSSISKEAFFIAPTKIVNKTDTLFAQPGSIYNTATRSSNFRGRTVIRTAKYDLVADTLNYDTPTEIGVAHGNVVFTSRSDSSILTGREGRYNGNSGLTRVWGNALLRNLRQRDTLFLSADTLLSREIRTVGDTIRRLFAFRNVLIFKRDFQGKCDSLAYYVNDSTLYFYKKPLLWNSGNQSEGDSVVLKLKNGQLHTMLLRGHAFVISKDTLQNFNQIKGRRITAYLDDSTRLERVFVEGNGESIYYALDAKNKLVGLNRSLSSKMTLRFAKGELERIAFVGKPDQKLYPPRQITDEIKTLDGFNWRLAQRPGREQILSRLPALTPKKVPLAKPVQVTPASKKKGPTKTPARKIPQRKPVPAVPGRSGKVLPVSR